MDGESAISEVFSKLADGIIENWNGCTSTRKYSACWRSIWCLFLHALESLGFLVSEGLLMYLTYL